MLKGEPFMFMAYVLLIAITILGLYFDLPLFFQVPIHTTLLIYIGAIHSTKQYQSRSPAAIGGPNPEKLDVMTQKDAWTFPIVGSAVLFGLFLLFKFFDKDNINLLFQVYFSVIGAYTIACYIYERVCTYPGFVTMKNVALFNIPPIKWVSDVESKIDLLFVFNLVIGTGVACGYYFTKHWTFNNILGMCFSIFGIENMLLGQFKVGFILLCLLFFYDIFWVFGTPVMVTVAKNLDGPIKLQFPKTLFGDKLEFNMIGLGDIVIPGVFVALMLRFDIVNYFKNRVSTPEDDRVPYSFGNVAFFNATLFGYVAGIFTTLFVMVYFKAAQPALLYLVPGILISSIFMALVKGNLSTLWNFDEEVELKLMSEKATN
jgi:minor histocompatibility antigen H13